MNKSLFLSLLFSSLLSLSLSFSDDSPVGPEEHPPMDCFPKSCGNVTNITYPFWVEGLQPRHCGFPAFRLSCRNDTPYLNIPHGEYQVREIFYEDQSVSLLDERFFTRDCPVLQWNFSLSSTPFVVSSVNRDLIFLFNCSGPPPDYYQIPCSSPNATFVHWGNESSSRGSCHSAIMPVLYSSGEDGVRDYLKVLRNGFVLNWTAAGCTDCTNSNGQCGYNIDRDNFMCICPDRAHYRSCLPVPAPGIHSNEARRIIIGSVVGVCFLLLCLLMALHCYKHRKIYNSVIFWKKDLTNNQKIEAFLEECGSLAPIRYSYSNVKKITKSFQEKLGQGGFGTVFKGSLSNGHLVAVKILKDSKTNGEEFINEVASIGRTSHVNIVSLLGFCFEGSKRALIYDFMCNGSLEKLLDSEKPKTTLDWKKLHEIAIGIARGLEYLHRGCNTRIVHFDIKPHNILLDQDFCPKISDFGLAKLCLQKESIISIAGARGTIGYIAPEVFSRNFGLVSSKSDVYSYGMMVLEIAGGRKNPKAGGADNGSEIYFPHWIYEHLNRNGNLLSYGVTAESEETMRKMVLVGLWCIQTLPQNRPSMSRVIEMMEGNVDDLLIPPEPHLSSSPFGSFLSSGCLLDSL